MKTIEEVKEYFKDAKEVKCLQDGIIFDLTKIKTIRDVHRFNEGFWMDGNFNEGSILLYQYGKFAEIISYKQKFEHLEEIEVSDDGISYDYLGTFIGMTDEKEYVIQYKNDGINFDSWKYARKINHEKNKVIDTINQLMKDNNIKKEEL